MEFLNHEWQPDLPLRRILPLGWIHYQVNWKEKWFFTKDWKCLKRECKINLPSSIFMSNVISLVIIFAKKGQKNFISLYEITSKNTLRTMNVKASSKWMSLNVQFPLGKFVLWKKIGKKNVSCMQRLLIIQNYLFSKSLLNHTKNFR